MDLFHNAIIQRPVVLEDLGMIVQGGPFETVDGMWHHMNEDEKRIAALESREPELFESGFSEKLHEALREEHCNNSEDELY